MRRRTFLAAGVAATAGCGRLTEGDEPVVGPTAWSDERDTLSVEADVTTPRNRQAPAVGELRPAWSATGSGATTSPPGRPLVVDGRVVQRRHHSLRAFDARDGSELWARTLDTPFSGLPIVADGTIYGLADGLCSFALESGTRRKLDPVRGRCLTRAGDRLLVGTDDTGTLVVTFDGRDRGRIDHRGAVQSYAVSDGLVVARTTTGIVGLDANDWSRRWQRELTGRARPGSRPFVGKTAVVTATGDGGLLAVERTTGKRRWRTRLPSNRLFSPLSVEGRTYVTDEAGRLFVVDGSTRRRVEPPAVEGPPGLAGIDMDRSPVLAGDRLLYPSPAGELLSVPIDGDEPTRLARFDHRVAAPPTVLPGAVVCNVLPDTYALAA